ATFALEQQLFGSKEVVKPAGDVALVRHVANVFLSILSVAFLLHLLREHILPESPYAAFIACVLFLAHPLHTEVIANVKSRDEILCFLFFILSSLLFIQYIETKNKTKLVLSAAVYFFCVFSKEGGLAYLAVFPLLLYFFKKLS